MIMQLIDLSGVLMAIVGIVAICANDRLLAYAESAKKPIAKKIADLRYVLVVAGISLAMPSMVWWHLIAGIVGGLGTALAVRIYKYKKLAAKKADKSVSTTEATS